MRGAAEGRVSEQELEAICEKALAQTISELEEAGSQVITDGEQLEPSFVTYPVQGLRSRTDIRGSCLPSPRGRSVGRRTRARTSSAHSATQHGRSSRR